MDFESIDIAELENETFSQYANHCEYCACGKALPDGAPDPSRYMKSVFRVIFVLKEAYGWDQESTYPRDLRQFARDGGAYKTWGNLARWCALTQDPEFKIHQMDASDPDQRAEKLCCSAFVNLKKVPGGKRSNPAVIADFSNRHAALLRKQLSIYKPHATITCGTFGALRNIYGAEQMPKPDLENGFVYFRTPELGTVIDFYHPQYLAISPSEYLRMLGSNLKHHFPMRFRS